MRIHKFEFNDVKGAGTIGYCSCGKRFAHAKLMLVYILCFQHLDYMERVEERV